jgi:hemolysin-activating ACP:hemolysin acyltransferase
MPGQAHHVTLPDAVAPFGGADVMVADLKQLMFPTREIRFVTMSPNGLKTINKR